MFSFYSTILLCVQVKGFLSLYNIAEHFPKNTVGCSKLLNVFFLRSTVVQYEKHLAKDLTPVEVGNPCL